MQEGLYQKPVVHGLWDSRLTAWQIPQTCNDGSSGLCVRPVWANAGSRTHIKIRRMVRSSEASPPAGAAAVVAPTSQAVLERLYRACSNERMSNSQHKSAQ